MTIKTPSLGLYLPRAPFCCGTAHLVLKLLRAGFGLFCLAQLAFPNPYGLQAQATLVSPCPGPPSFGTQLLRH